MVMSQDVVIVGSGTVGATLACALLQAGLRVALVDSAPLPVCDLARTDLRVFALTRASERIFSGVNVWEELVKLRVSRLEKMFVWDAQGFGEIGFDCRDLCEPLLGYVVEQQVLQAGLLARLGSFSDLTVLRPAQVRSLRVLPECVEVVLDSGERLVAGLVVGAEGVQSGVRVLSGIAYRQVDYAQQAIVATVRTEMPHGGTARQCFLPNGVLAFLPLVSPCECSIVWSLYTPDAQEVMGLGDVEFGEMLTRVFAGRLGKVLAVGERGVFPLVKRHAVEYVKPRVALVGDAAHTVHPLAGQGVNLGLLDAAALCDVVVGAWRVGEDMGNLGVLRRYERWRRGDNVVVQGAMDGFKLLFNNSSQGLSWLRGVGLLAVDAAVPLKVLLMRRAMGLAGDLPSLAR